MEIKDHDFLQKCLSEAVGDVFGTMAGLEPCAVQKIFDEESNLSCGEIAGTMMIQGASNAMLSLTMSKENAAILLSYMTGVQSDELSAEDLYDGAAEMVNMIAGRAKALLAGTGYHYSLTPPFTIVGPNHFIVYKKKVAQFIMKFTAGEAVLYLRLSYL